MRRFLNVETYQFIRLMSDDGPVCMHTHEIIVYYIKYNIYIYVLFHFEKWNHLQVKTPARLKMVLPSAKSRDSPHIAPHEWTTCGYRAVKQDANHGQCLALMNVYTTVKALIRELKHRLRTIESPCNNNYGVVLHTVAVYLFTQQGSKRKWQPIPASIARHLQVIHR